MRAPRPAHELDQRQADSDQDAGKDAEDGDAGQGGQGQPQLRAPHLPQPPQRRQVEQGQWRRRSRWRPASTYGRFFNTPLANSQDDDDDGGADDAGELGARTRSTGPRRCAIPTRSPGSPGTSPAATLAVPRAKISWLGSTWSPRLMAMLRDNAEVSASVTKAIPAAAPIRRVTSWIPTCGNGRPRKALGDDPDHRHAVGGEIESAYGNDGTDDGDEHPGHRRQPSSGKPGSRPARAAR